MDKNNLSHEEKDFLLWSYLHDELTIQEKIDVEKELSSNIEWQKKLIEWQKSESILSNMEAEIPSLRFSKNVMESITQSSIAQPTRYYINKRIVLAIGYGFIAIITAFTVFALSQTKWSNNSHTPINDFKLPVPKIYINWDFTQNASWLYGFFAIVLVCFFILMDKYLTHRRKYKTN